MRLLVLYAVSVAVVLFILLLPRGGKREALEVDTDDGAGDVELQRSFPTQRWNRAERNRADRSPDNLPGDIASWLEKPESPERERALCDLLARVKPRHLESVLNVFNSLPDDGREHEMPFTELMRRWAEFDGDGAFAYGLRAADDPGVRREFYFATGPALEAWAVADLPTAAGAVLALPPGLAPMDQNRFAIYLMEAFARQNPAAGVEWNERLAADPWKADFLGHSLLALARGLAQYSDAHDHAEWLVAFQSHPAALDAIGWQGWFHGNADPAFGSQWIDKLDNKVARTRAVGELMSQWAMTAPKEAARWIQAAGQREDFSWIVESYVRGAFREQPAAARAWISRVEPSTRRYLALEIADHFAATDAREAEFWRSVANP